MFLFSRLSLAAPSSPKRRDLCPVYPEGVRAATWGPFGCIITSKQLIGTLFSVYSSLKKLVWKFFFSCQNPRCKVCGGTPEVRSSKHLFLNLTKVIDILSAALSFQFEFG